MKKLLKMEAYELTHDYICLLMIGITLFLGMFSGSSYLKDNYFNLTQGGYEVFIAMLYDAPGSCILICAFPALIIGKSFSNRTIVSKVVSGNSRRNIFFSKAISILFITTIAMIIYAASGAVVVTIKYGWNAPNVSVVITLIKIIICTSLLYIDIFSPIIFWAVIFRDTVRTVTASVITIFFNALFMAYSIMLHLPISMHPMLLLRTVLANNSLSQFTMFSLYAIVLLSAILLVSYNIFCKSELK